MGDKSSSNELHITFPFVPGEPYDPADRYPFWNLPTTISWFKERGYTLYERVEDGISRPALPFEPYQEANFPCANYDSRIYEYEDTSPAEPLLAEDSTGKIVYAQDALKRHVVIKLVRDDTDEYRILRFLSEQDLTTLEENCVIPVFELLPTRGYWFAVMPRWGSEVYLPPFSSLSDVVDLIHSMLKGLVFLHNHNISHGDLNLRNVLVNHFSDYRTIFYSFNRKELRRDRSLSYALFDFDFSTMFPPHADKRSLRLPYQRSWGTFGFIRDTGAGEYEYDPFAFDVGGLGLSLRSRYIPLIPVFPPLAPLFDMMTTWDVHRRFTATEALQFFESHLPELSDDELELDISKQLTTYLGPDPWKTLPPELVEKWQMYKTPPRPWSRRLLFWISDKRWMCHIVPWTRWFGFQMFSVIPHGIYRWFFPSKISL